MKHNKRKLEAIIDDVTREIRDEQIDPSMIDESATLVWARVSQEAANPSSATSNLESINTMNASNGTEHIHGCADFQSLIPAYLDGKLSTARTLLLEDHSNECIPCRQELKAQKAYAATKSATYVPRQHVSRATQRQQRASTSARRIPNAARWAVAAVLVVSIGLAGMFMY